jgi:hypothetical protein
MEAVRKGLDSADVARGREVRILENRLAEVEQRLAALEAGGSATKPATEEGTEGENTL